MTQATQPVWSPEWSNAVFSTAERDRRWANVRRLMREAGIDAIVAPSCTNGHGRGSADHRYLTQLGDNSEELTVAFPLDGAVTAWHSRGGVWPSSNWFDDIRPTPRGTSGMALAAWLRERGGYASARIGIAGLRSTHLAHVRAREGEVNYTSVEVLKEAFPTAVFVDATPVLGAARYVKSDEEIGFLRKATSVAERTLDALLESARPGVREHHVFAKMLYANAEAGGTFTPMFGWISGPRTAPYHRLEQPSFRTFALDDMLSVEIEGRWGGHIAQIDQTVTLGKAHPETVDANKRAVEAFERVMAAMKPGVTLRELIVAANAKKPGSEMWTGLGGHGRGTGDDGPLLVAGREYDDEFLNITLEAGCSFAIKPSTFDGNREVARWGDTVAVTSTGAERLGVRIPQLHELA
jgi:Xaa-Pro aminopeptidase